VGEDMVEAMPMQESKLEAQFASDQMDAQRLSAFEARAQQKLQDLADYINILRDKSLDSTFRQQAMKQAVALFENENIPFDKNPENEIAISDFLTNLLSENQLTSKFTIDSIQIVKPLQAIGSERYEGILSFEDNIASVQAPDKITPKQIGMVLRKIKKEFGTEDKWVWEVFLSQTP
jgi:hypothetical protein